MIEYSFSKINARKITRKRVIRRLPVFIIAVFVGFYFANIDSDGMLIQDSLTLFISALVIAILLAVGLGYGIELRVKRLLKEKYILSETFIEKKTFPDKSIKIPLDNVEFFQKNKGLLLMSNDDEILIPEELDGYQELKTNILEKIRKESRFQL